jgi:copper oxidase (laccase) domain-containing protein
MKVETKIFDHYEFSVYNQKPDGHFYQVHQIHSDQIVNIDQINATDELLKADGIMWQGKLTKPVVIITADCLPVFILGNKGAALLHAGWRGLASGIHLSGKLEQIEPQFAHIGPYIHGENYPVGEEFIQHFGPGHWLELINHQWYFYQDRYISSTLQTKYPKLVITISDQNTWDNQQLFSHRRAPGQGRNWNMIQAR